VISNQARFRREQVTFAGEATAWTRTAESGNAVTFHFCPTCGSTVYWEGQGFPGYVAVAIGSFLAARHAAQAHDEARVTKAAPDQEVTRLYAKVAGARRTSDHCS
jgi:hypothetical protein